MKRKNNILLISIPLGVLLLLYYGYIALDTWLQFQIRTGNGLSLIHILCIRDRQILVPDNLFQGHHLRLVTFH